MKALTICQPYAHLIALPDDHPRAKRVENRSWSTDYRGPLAIHAGKSSKYLEVDDDGFDEYGIPLSEMSFGAIVAVHKLVGCVRGSYHNIPAWASNKWPWLEDHEHTEGPYCWVLTGVLELPEPIPCRGAQGLWNVPEDVLERLGELR